MVINNFEEMRVWVMARDLAIELMREFKTCKDYGFVDQIQSAAVSISNNIAEGFERRSDSQFIYFLKIAKGYAGEVRSMLAIAHGAGYIDKSKSDKARESCHNIAGSIVRLSKSLKN